MRLARHIEARRCWYCGLQRIPGVEQECPEGGGQACRADTNQYANVWVALAVTAIVAFLAALAACERWIG